MVVKKFELLLQESVEWERDYDVILNTSEDVADFAFHGLQAHTWDREKFVAIALNSKAMVIGYNVVSIGSLSTTTVHPREVIKFAVMANAAAVILLHNHPSGDVTPSETDIETTMRLSEALKLVGIKVLDHIITGEKESFLALYRAGYIE